jgi:hypothetical protein
MSSLEAIWRHDRGLLIPSVLENLDPAMFLGYSRQHCKGESTE